MKELQDKIDRIIDWLTEPDGGNAVDESDIKDAKIELRELKEQLRLNSVIVPKGTLPKCEHKHIVGGDGCFECADCGA